MASNRGPNGKNLLTHHIAQVERQRNMAFSPSNSSPLANNGISSHTSDTDSPKAQRKASLFTTLRARRPQIFSPDSPSNPTALDLSPPASSSSDFQLPYKWNFYHDSHAAGEDYEKRLTLMQDEIATIKTFWQVLNSFPLSKLQMRDSVHFFKQGVRPIWEDPRNVKGGAWYFRISKDRAEDFWKEILMMAVGEQFADAIQKGRFLFSVCHSSGVITHQLTHTQVTISAASPIQRASTRILSASGTATPPTKSRDKGFFPPCLTRFHQT